MRNILKIFLLLLILTASLATIASAQPTTTSFTYQGKLTDGGAAANGTYDLEFKLFNALSGGAQVDSTIVRDDVLVTAGVFTVTLDIGSAGFIFNPQLFLQIGVRPGASTEAFTPLSPRQPITSSPYAIKSAHADSAFAADSASSFTQNLAGDVTGGQDTTLVTRLQGRAIASTPPTSGQVLTWNNGALQWEPAAPSTGNFIQNTTTTQPLSNFNISGAGVVGGNFSVVGTITGNGSGITNLNPANISAGTANINIQGVAANNVSITTGATPSVANRTFLTLTYAGETIITDLTGGIEGQCVTLLQAGAIVSIVNGGKFRLASNWNPTSDDVLTVCQNNISGGPLWYERSRSNNAKVTLSLQAPGGSIVVGSTGQECFGFCEVSVPRGSPLTLIARPGPDAFFSSWFGGCGGNIPVCTFVPLGSGPISAFFGTHIYTLSIVKTGMGLGTVTSSPGSINCGSTCSDTFVSGNNVNLTATPATNSLFTGWSGGGCSGTGLCFVTMDSAKTVVANFALVQQTLTVTSLAGAAGTVTTMPSGISCPPTCSASYDHGTLVVLTAIPATNNVFTGWSGGGCSGTVPLCAVTMDTARNVTAYFDQGTFVLGVTTGGGGSGIVTSSPNGIDCGTTCSANFYAGSTVTLTATPFKGSTFAGWLGDCSGKENACMVSMTAARSVSATFYPK